jgi:hypothetical protein
MRLSEVLDGGSVTVRASRFGVSRQSVHFWLPKFLVSGGAGHSAPLP